MGNDKFPKADHPAKKIKKRRKKEIKNKKKRNVKRAKSSFMRRSCIKFPNWGIVT